MNILMFFSTAWSWIIDPKNRTKVFMLAIVALFALLLVQCSATRRANDKAEEEKNERIRIENNYEASNDTIRQYKLDDSTWRPEKLGYTLKVSDLKKEYSDLLGKFELEKNKPPKVLIQTVYQIRDSIVHVPILVELDSNGNGNLSFS